LRKNCFFSCYSSATNYRQSVLTTTF